ncbi:hypothetical protein NFI96_033714 [Prochilodus magdalenae]|nr:hypothetical protein NFI96_033714 [Prochilodus magdalenae]
MKLQTTLAVLGLLLVGSQAHPVLPNVTEPLCDSLEAQAGAQVSLDFINGQLNHGYKYALNQIEDIKISTLANGTEIYLMELEFLETKCHILDPTPVALCPIRPKQETAVEADCDVALSNSAGVLSVVAFKCKTETETPDLPCAGCPYLIPFNDIGATQLVKDSLDIFNANNTHNAVFSLLEVGRLSSQIVSGGPKLIAEYVVIETNCTTVDDGICVPLNHTVARHGVCLSTGIDLAKTVDCTIFDLPADLNDTVLPAPPAVLLHAHTAGPGYTPTIHALKHHKLTPLHDPSASGLLSESAESVEVPVVLDPPAAPIVKREIGPVEEVAAILLLAEAPLTVAKPLVPRCPGKVLHF